MFKQRKQTAVLFILILLITAIAAVTVSADSKDAKIKILAPRNGDVAGVGSRGFIVDLAIRFEGDLAATGAALELTGPGAHANIAPFPGDFGAGADPSLPGLVVLLSSSKVGAGSG